jgi:hypothetical protein
MCYWGDKVWEIAIGAEKYESTVLWETIQVEKVQFKVIGVLILAYMHSFFKRFFFPFSFRLPFFF